VPSKKHRKSKIKYFEKEIFTLGNTHFHQKNSEKDFFLSLSYFLGPAMLSRVYFILFKKAWYSSQSPSMEYS